MILLASPTIIPIANLIFTEKIDPLGRPTDMARSDHYIHTCYLSVRCENSDRYWWDCGLAEWINNDRVIRTLPGETFSSFKKCCFSTIDIQWILIHLFIVFKLPKFLFLYFLARNFLYLIHSANPQSRSLMITIFTHVCTYPTFQNLTKQNKFKVKIVIAG